MSPFVERAREGALPVKDLTGLSTPDLIRALRDSAGDIACPAGCACHGTFDDGTPLPERKPFVPTQWCTPHCGLSHFEDWLHTPKCAADYAAAMLHEEHCCRTHEEPGHDCGRYAAC